MKLKFFKTTGLIILLLLSFATVHAQILAESDDNPNSINYEGAVIDERCVREQISDPEGAYAKFCKRDNNTEKDIVCLNKAFPQSSGFFGLFDIFKSRVRITPETLPSLIRMVITIAFAVVGVSALWITVWGYNKWMMALNNSPEEAAKLWKVFTNGIWGLIFSLGSLLLTWAIFWAAGVRRNDFFEVGNEIAGLLSFPCEDLSKNEEVCKKFNYSCVHKSEDVSGKGQPTDPQCRTKTPEEKSIEIRAIQTLLDNKRVATNDNTITYTGGNPCL